MTGCIQNLRKCRAKCCTFFELRVPNITPDLIKYYELHKGVQYMGDGILRFNIRCSALTYDFKCGINSSKPQICHEYPRQDDPIPKKCIFKKVCLNNSD